jgi:hypothetical protein
MPALATIKRAPQWVSYGPPNTDGGASDWCRLSTGTRDSWYQDHAAPGGIILCKRDTTELHPEAKRYAREAWVAYGRYIAALHPKLAKDWAPTPIVETGSRTVQWKQGEEHYTRNAQRTPGDWYLVDITDKTHPRIYTRADYFAELEWSRFARENITAQRNGTDQLRRSSMWAGQPAWMPPLPIFGSDTEWRKLNKHTRRAITTKADRIAADKIIKRPVAAGAA